MDYTLKKYSIFTAKGLKALNSYIEDGATKLGLYINKTNMLKRDRYDIKHWNICKTQEETRYLINATLDWIEGTYWMRENYNIINDIKTTPSGAISTANGCNTGFIQYRIQMKASRVSLILCIGNYIFGIKTNADVTCGKDSLRPDACYREYIKCIKEKTGIDITKEGSKYVISKEEGKAIHDMKDPRTGVSYLGSLMVKRCTNNVKFGKTYEHVYHIDFHSAFPSCLCDAFPELKPGIEYMYNNRKKDPRYKQVLVKTNGFFFSQYCNYKHAHLAKESIERNYQKIEKIALALIKRGNKVLSYNVDGIWVVMDPNNLYTDENRGNGLQHWDYDHKDCKIRYKSAGSYEFIEGDKYTPCVSGCTTYERIKPRSEWVWGDIFRGDTFMYYMENGRIVRINMDNDKTITEDEYYGKER